MSLGRPARSLRCTQDNGESASELLFRYGNRRSVELTCEQHGTKRGVPPGRPILRLRLPLELGDGGLPELGTLHWHDRLPSHRCSLLWHHRDLWRQQAASVVAPRPHRKSHQPGRPCHGISVPTFLLSVGVGRLNFCRGGSDVPMFLRQRYLVSHRHVRSDAWTGLVGNLRLGERPCVAAFREAKDNRVQHHLHHVWTRCPVCSPASRVLPRHLRRTRNIPPARGTPPQRLPRRHHHQKSRLDAAVTKYIVYQKY